MTIISMNVRDFSPSGQMHSDVFNWVRRKKVLINCFEEARITAEVERLKESVCGYFRVFSSFSSSSPGVVKVFKIILIFKFILYKRIPVID